MWLSGRMLQLVRRVVERRAADSVKVKKRKQNVTPEEDGMVLCLQTKRPEDTSSRHL